MAPAFIASPTMQAELRIARLKLATTTNAVVTIAIRLRYDYDPTTTYRARLFPIRRKQKLNMSFFRRSHIVVESQLCDIGLTSTNLERLRRQVAGDPVIRLRRLRLGDDTNSADA